MGGYGMFQIPASVFTVNNGGATQVLATASNYIGLLYLNFIAGVIGNLIMFPRSNPNMSIFTNTAPLTISTVKDTANSFNVYWNASQQIEVQNLTANPLTFQFFKVP